MPAKHLYRALSPDHHFGSYKFNKQILVAQSILVM